MIKADNFNTVKKHLKQYGIIFKYVNISRIKSRLERDGIAPFIDRLSPWELAYIGNLKIMKRKSDFLSGRIAGKEAVKEILSSENRPELLNSKDIDIRRMDSGAPRVFVNNNSVEIILSISHSGHTALALAVKEEHFRGIGIDIERIDARDESFINIAFGSSEISGLKRKNGNTAVWDDEKITLCWTIKEALLKSINSGFDMNLKDIEINCNSDNEISLKLKNAIKKKFNKTGKEKPVIRSYRLNDFIISAVFVC